MTPCTLDTLREEMRSLYAPTTHAPKTWFIMRQVLDELHEAGVRSTDQLNPALIARWMEAHEGRASMTSRKLLSSLRTLCNYCQHEGYIAKNPFGFRGLRQWVRGVKSRKKRHHSWEDLSKVLSMLSDEVPNGWENHRLFALFATYIFTGVRKLEALRLYVEDFDLEAGFVSVVARDRLKTLESEDVIPLPRQLVPILAEWLPKTGCKWAFPHGRRTGPWTEGPAGMKPLDQVKKAGVRAGVAGLTILSLRHSWATHAESRWGIPEAVIKRVLRHTSIATQLNYRHPDMVNLRAQVGGISFDLSRPGADTAGACPTQPHQGRAGDGKEETDGGGVAAKPGGGGAGPARPLDRAIGGRDRRLGGRPKGRPAGTKQRAGIGAKTTGHRRPPAVAGYGPPGGRES